MNTQAQYLQVINKSNVIVLPSKIKDNALGALSRDPPLSIAPLNTDIRLGSLPKMNIDPSLIGVMAARSPPPDNYFLQKDHKYGKYIESPRNQDHCGSCWAISAAGIISDCFVVKGLTNFSPMLSTTYILATYPQNQCNGGSQAKVYTDIQNGGITSEHCVNYKWCEDNSSCNPGSKPKEGGKEFTGGDLMTYLNTQIPKSGCYFPDNKQLYFISDTKTITPENPNDASQLVTFKNLSKFHIMEEGPISAGYIVLENFVGAKNGFKLTNDIYFDNVDYINENLNNLSTFKQVGGHAVTVVGWGIEKDVTYAPNKKDNIAYWIVRNSWGTSWNNGGYFKMAMYPHNKSCGFDIPVKLPDGTSIGGFVLCKADKIELNKINKTIQNKNIPPESIDFYKSENIISKNIIQKNKVEKNIIQKIVSSSTFSSFSYYLLYICIFLFTLCLFAYIIWYLYHLYKKRSTIIEFNEPTMIDISNMPENVFTNLSKITPSELPNKQPNSIPIFSSEISGTIPENIIKGHKLKDIPKEYTFDTYDTKSNSDKSNLYNQSKSGYILPK